jgi:hypothetical protein
MTKRTVVIGLEARGELFTSGDVPLSSFALDFAPLSSVCFAATDRLTDNTQYLQIFYGAALRLKTEFPTSLMLVGRLLGLQIFDKT